MAVFEGFDGIRPKSRLIDTGEVEAAPQSKRPGYLRYGCRTSVNRSGVGAPVKITVFSTPAASISFTMSSTCCGGRAPWQCTSMTGYLAFVTSVFGTR